MLKIFQMESQKISWLEAMYDAVFSRGKKIVWVNPAGKKKVVFLTANAVQGMIKGFFKVHKVPESGKKTLHIHLFHVRDSALFYNAAA